jgi:hypothetical protein
MNANSDHEYIDNKVGDVRTAVDDLRVTMSDRFETVNAKLDAYRTETLAVIDGMIAKAFADITKWLAAIIVAMIALFLAAAGLMVTLLPQYREAVSAAPAPAQVTPTPAVIIQLTPQGATVLPAAPSATP